MGASLSRARLITIATFLLVAATPMLGHAYLTRTATSILVFGLVVLSLDLIVGFGGMVSFGHAAFFGLGAYTTAILGFYGIHSAFVTLPSSILVSAVGAILIGAISLRTSGVYFIMITLAFAQMLYFLVHALAAYGGDDGLKVVRNYLIGADDMRNPVIFFYLVGCVFLVAFYCSTRLVRSRYGRVLRGIKENRARAESLGYDAYRYQLAGFVISGALAGLAGMLHANLDEYVSPELFGWVLSGDLLVMLILGGAGTLVGAVFGATIYLALQQVLSAYTTHWMLFLGPLLLLVVVFSSRGVYGLLVGKQRHV